ncbi:DUF5615 family PIN-like protein [Dyadobacter sandarakinus]|uniref:DUF5615 family PIN-like protein n=1 Tax=Dyadobacter sandarakinus TaxID=2747268 RepID=A0ABX7I7S1_9BACT|nr:DUF5615 family PIN-like protein [Dyadobacter sandarakinus]QRR01840.1 DUF5615 family PIN-like protein [Dyadobacter sandarakinus]
MKLLVDQNISYRIIPLLLPAYPEIYHICDFGLINADDQAIFMFGRENAFNAVITCDDDFVRLLNVMGPAAKIDLAAHWKCFYNPDCGNTAA